MESNEEAKTQEESNNKEELVSTVDKLQEQLDRKEALLKREEELIARKLLGGKSEQSEEPKPRIETDAEYTRRVEREIREGVFN